MRAIVTVIGKDHVGIIADVTALLAQYGVNVLDISQTVLQEYFTMIMLVDAAQCTVPFADLARTLDEVRHTARPADPRPARGHLQRHAPHLRGHDHDQPQ